MRLVIKIGTSTLAHSTGRINIRRVEELCKVLSDIKNAGHEIIIVSSGAIGMGMGTLGISRKNADMPTKQAAASIGQCELMYTYDKLFGEYNHIAAQLLITGEDIENDMRRLNFQSTLFRLLELGAIPIVNENDTVATHEIEIGDNDTLSAIVSVCVKADLLLILSDVDGLYTKNPHKYKTAKLISVVEELTPEIMSLAEGVDSDLGTGGMLTKLNAAQICTSRGINMQIISGSTPSSLYDVIEGKAIGTFFKGKVL